MINKKQSIKMANGVENLENQRVKIILKNSFNFKLLRKQFIN